MPPKTIKHALKNTLAGLSKDDFANFCHQLLDRREEPQVKRNKVEGKSFLVIADVLVSTFTEAKAVEVAVELLEDIDCSEDAEKLVREMSALSSNPGSNGTAGPSAGAAGAEDECSSEDHFVDRYREQLVNRVSNVECIMDALLQRKVIQPAIYDEILEIPTTRRKMRKLYSGPLNAAGDPGKDIFFNILEEMEPLLMAGLQKKK